ncbi:hypothetical protein A8H35_26755 [Burkholderia thailandensis]|nr:hypothetical protein WJ27_20400 [Burkholderia thailandensis]AOJ59052.1 hypothetical protein AQ477_20925 [Burkholderia thailandensis]AVR06892.1 hypothetical protein A8H31_04745 [Burkholderia thailandensis]AWY61709.1 hypothetical protein A8H35_26755 [Burkholderia thailandensis]AWY65795.1 hypothetical protein A8H36_11920 [Burkholderia thailandensis]
MECACARAHAYTRETAAARNAMAAEAARRVIDNMRAKCSTCRTADRRRSRAAPIVRGARDGGTRRGVGAVNGSRRLRDAFECVATSKRST